MQNTVTKVKNIDLQNENEHLRNLLLEVTKENMHLIAELNQSNKNKMDKVETEHIYNLQLTINTLEQENINLRHKYHEEQKRKNKINNENMELKETITDLETKLLIVKQRYIDSLNKNGELTKDRERLRNKAKLSCDQVQRLNSQFKETKLELENSSTILEANTARYEHAIQALEKELKNFKIDNQKFQRTLNIAHNETNHFSETKRTLENEIKQLKAMLECKDEEIIEKAEELNNLRLEMDERIEFAIEDRSLTMESKLRNRDSKIKELERIIATNNVKLAQNEELICELKEKIDESFLQSFDLLLMKNKKLDENFDEIKCLNEELWEKNVSLNKSLENVEKRNIELEGEKNLLNERLKQYVNIEQNEKHKNLEQLNKNTEVQLVQNEKTKIISNYEKRIIEFKNKIKLKDNEKQLLEKENDELKKQAKKNVEEKSENFLMMNELQLKISKTLTTSNTLNDIIKERTEENLLLKEENMKMQAKINSLILENENFKREKHLYVSNVEDFNSKKEKDLIENSKLLEKLENAGKKEFDFFKEKEQLKTQLYEKQIAINELEGTIQGLKANLEQIKNDSTNRLTFLEQSLTTATEQNILLQDEIRNVRSDLVEYTKSSAELQEFNEQLVENKEISEAVANKAKIHLLSAAKKMKDDKAQISALKKQLTKDRMKFAEILASKDILLDYYKSLCEEEEEESEKEEVIETEKEN
eukprot:TRINITY_DN2536_c0_g1_i1.p1 TRINITY_DN2536_c0_g1~~TRINITY_DN2536_c0_g1_i1.p1  ORF type:complete len:708 (+),score=251.67 TRINITY_DN2536_c0_g1_i1:72-2195(+)